MKAARQLTIGDDNYNQAKATFESQKKKEILQPVSLVQHAKTGRYSCFIVHKRAWLAKYYPNFKIIETTEK